MSQGNLSDLYAAYPGNPTGVAVSIFNCKKGTVVIDTVNALAYQKKSEINDNSDYELLGVINDFTDTPDFQLGFSFSDVASQNIARNALALDKAVYVSTTGSDTTGTGTRLLPYATGATALTKINGNGKIVYLEGDYLNEKLVLTNSLKLEVSAEPNKQVRIFLGESASSFTNVAGATSSDPDNVYKKTITTSIPAAGDNIVWIFEQGTPEGLISSDTVTISLASPGVFTLANHGLSIGDPVTITTTGALPTGLTAGSRYYVLTTPTRHTFTVATTRGGSAINTSVSQSGVHTLYANKSHPLQRGRQYRCDNAALTVAPSLADLQSGANGRYFFTGTTLYIKATDAANLATSPKTYWIPSQTEGQSFISGCNFFTDVTVRAIEVYYGKNNFDFSYTGHFRVEGCRSIGAGVEGMTAARFLIGESVLCEYGQNANDGIGTSNDVTDRCCYLTLYDDWIHDNGDEGFSSGHGTASEPYHCLGLSHGGLFENQSRGGGITTFHSRHTAHDPYTRNNLYGINAAGFDQIDAYNLTSINDTYGVFLSGGSDEAICNLWSPTILNVATAVTSAGSLGVINTYNPRTDSPGLQNGGAGVVNVKAAPVIVSNPGVTGQLLEWIEMSYTAAGVARILVRQVGGSARQFEIGTADGGPVLIVVNGSQKLYIGPSGHLLPINNNAQDLGGDGNAYRDLWITRQIQIPGGATAILKTTSAITSGAGASTATLTNSPAVGNPTKWIPINDNGTTRYIPAW